MNKVIVEINENGWTAKAILNGEEYVEEYARTGSGTTQQVSDYSFQDCEDIFDDLYEALSSFFAFDVMQALKDC